MKNLLITFSGGRTSGLMAKLVLESPLYENYNKLFCFANTGKEDEETLKFVDRCDKEFNLNLVWLEAKVFHGERKGTTYNKVTFETASRNGEPFEEVVKKYGLPSKMYRHCTRELKEYPIHKYAKEYFGSKDYLTAVGIRADEKHRLSNDPKKIYPLAELNFTSTIVRNWWDRNSFDLKLKDYEGNCDLCFLKSVRKKKTIIKENPEKAEWWDRIERENPRDKQPIFDVYRDLSVPQLVELAKEDFKMVKDSHTENKQQSFNFDEDLEFDCFCKNT